MDRETVLVTGASGYIASHLVYQLLQENYQVRGTVRSLKDTKKVDPIVKLAEGRENQLELIEADLLDPDCWIKAVSGCTFVQHTASPFPSTNPKNEDELIKPAVDGTLNVLRACKEAGNVKRVVLTSSVAAISSGNYESASDRIYTEEDWTNLDKADTPYEKSKTLAEKAAWDYMDKLEGSDTFELSVINPVLVMGPVLCGTFTTSMEIPKRLMLHEMPMIPKLNFSIIDVRDVAAAHIAAMKVPEAAGKRHILSSGSIWVPEMAQVLKTEFQPHGYNIPTTVAPYPILWLNGHFDKSVKMILPLIGKELKHDNQRMVNILGIKPRSVNETIIDMCYSLIDAGHVKKTKKFKPSESVRL